MTPTIWTAIIGLIGSLIVVVLTYWFTKQRERETEWRKEKLAYYKAFVESISGILEGEDTPEGHQIFARATNNLLLFAPQPVIDALNAYRHELRLSNQNRSDEQFDKVLKAVLIAIRRDVGVFPADNVVTFKPILWASGIRKD